MDSTAQERDDGEIGRRNPNFSKRTMSFPTSTGVLLPADFEIVHAMFSKIASEDPLTPSEERREQFAIVVIDAYRQGYDDPAALAEPNGKLRPSRSSRFG